MPRLSEILGSDIHAANGDPTGSPVAYEATITAVSGGLVSIVVPGYSEIHDFAGLKYLAPGGTPSVGDDAIAIFTDARDPLVLVPGEEGTGFEHTANKGAASGYAPLDSGLLVPVANLPDATTGAKGIVQLAGDLAGTAASPQIAAGAVGATELAAGIVLQLATTGTARKVAFGTSSTTHSTAVTSARKTIAHGLSGTPIFYTVFFRVPVQFNVIYREDLAPDSTNIYIVSVVPDLATTANGTQNCYWLAIG